MNNFIASLVGVIIATAILTPLAVRHLHTATVLQCQTQDWPIQKHEAHAAFCATYLDRPSN